MQCVDTEIPDVKVIVPAVHGDARGFFKETWNALRFGECGLPQQFVQDNQSRSVGGTLRGLHYQVRQPQGKLVWVLAGEVYDVALDLRRSSPTFGRWVGRRLSAAGHAMLWIPAGFAHGFYALGESVELAYKCTDFYAPEHERTVLWNDPDLAIEWPLTEGRPPLLSARDAAGVRFRDAEAYA
ncbi:MAG: dTDP-4-dehydrorhamnose 3,5-epimerase [Gammaproteobacteria bacterium]|nr:dTDP-4-dehydrorhamnose 3,5-epimerase [Gammaproteobacteria bacterium]